ncbi:MAG: hypothetical protein WCC22_08720 [Terriglobales bacterium]
MKPLAEVEIAKSFKAAQDRRAAQPEISPSSPALLWLETAHDTERKLRKVWNQKMVRPATELMLKLVNMGDSPTDIGNFRKHIPTLTDIARLSDEDLLALRDELQGLWKELEKEWMPSGPSGQFGNSKTVAVTLHRLWHHYELDSQGYMIFWETGSFFPTQQNFRGVIARILFEKRRYLALCAGCHHYIIKKRVDQKLCLGQKCERKANSQRQAKHKARKGNSARKGRRGA